MNLLVLAGGFGTRLKTVIREVPKALAPIGDVPFLQLQIANWLAQGIREFTFLLHHQADLIVAFLKSHESGLLRGCKVEWLIEPMPMDTGGAIANAVKTFDLKNDFLMTNADTWLGGGIFELIQSPAPAMAVVNLSVVSRYGQVHFDREHRVIAFAEKTGQCTAGWISAGLCHLNAELFSNWNGEPFSLERDLFFRLAQKNCLIAVPLQTDFIDIGVPSDYHRFCNWVAAGARDPLCN